jgi:hypothetical protein
MSDAGDGAPRRGISKRCRWRSDGWHMDRLTGLLWDEAMRGIFCFDNRIIEHAKLAPLMDFRQLIGLGPKVAENAIDLRPVYAFPSWRMFGPGNATVSPEVQDDRVLHRSPI